ncbi:MAG TPA: glycosyltransferase family 2 protein [Solirubrobacteraceae bacterium]|nr:glycosyltransferase family 2 protein [Solirubrobacteraceae bacterium]
MLTVVIPMAGRGSRFADAGYTVPKPLLPIHGVPMIEAVVRNLTPSEPVRFVFISRREHVEDYGFVPALRRVAPGCVVVPIEELTEGAACTVALGETAVDPEDVLVIANSDQWVDHSMDAHLTLLRRHRLDGLIMTMAADDPKWSFVELDGEARVTRVVEKEVVSSEATVGIYTFRRAGEYFRAARAMIAGGKRVNGEFYVAPVYNELIEEGARIGIDNIGADRAGMYGLGTPADYEDFLRLPVSHRAAGRPLAVTPAG